MRFGISAHSSVRLQKAVVGILATAFLATAFYNPEASSGAQNTVTDNKLKRESELMITIVFDNNPWDSSLTMGFGFACVIEAGTKKILFDTGIDGEILLSNMGKLNLPPKDIDVVVLSHNHYDHTGGLKTFLDRNSAVQVYLPKSFPDGFKQEVGKSGAEVVDVHERCKICEGVYSTGELNGGIREQSLICETPQGIVVITGCAHPGIVKIVKEARKTSGDVYLVMGGFHLSGESNAVVQKIVDNFKRLDVDKVCPCHCTGDRARELFLEAYGENCILGGVGTRLEGPGE